MEIILGKTAGFCGGVINAVNKTERELESGKKIYCLGELTHNQVVMSDLEAKGLCVVQNIQEVPEGETMIIRAHGVPPEIYEEAESKKIRVTDLTCPKVLKIHKQVEEYIENGYYLFLTGKRNHPETIGICGYGKDRLILIENLDDIEEAILEMKNKNPKKIAIISQTTFSMEKFEQISIALKQSFNNLEINNTICSATKIRQEETENISKEVQAMIIIGGKNSSNTKKLYEIALKNCKNVFLIETKDELDLKQIRKFEKIGIMAGASTPKISIEETINCIKKEEEMV